MNALTYLVKLVRFAIKDNPLWIAGALLSLLSVGLELVAMASLFPLSAIAGSQELPEGSEIVKLVRGLGLSPDIATFLRLFLALFAIRMITHLLSLGLTAYLSRRLQARLSSQAFEIFIRDFSIAEIDRQSIGYFTQMAGDEASRASTVVSALSLLLSQATMSILYFSAIVYYSPPTALAVAAFLALSFLSMLGIFRRSHRLGIRQVDQSRGTNSLFIDSLNGLRSVRAFSSEGYVAGRYRSAIDGYTGTLFQVEMLTHISRQLPVLLLLGACFAFTTVKASELNAGVNFAFTMTVLVFLMRFFPAVGQCLNTFMRLVSESKVGRDLTAVIERAPVAPKADAAPLGGVGTLRLEDVDFAYGDRPPVVQGVTLTLERGRSYALIGPSGSGKSTVLDLIFKFRTPTAGALSLDGRDLHTIDERALRGAVTMLGQDTTIFNDTVLNNIALGRPSHLDEVERACRLACIHNDVLALPQGYDTVLSYRGANLSGGQRQRIGIARALLRDADMLILDESTSALDPETRTQVVDNILKVYGDRIVVFVTHDPSIITRADVCIDLPSINQADTAAHETPAS